MCDNNANIPKKNDFFPFLLYKIESIININPNLSLSAEKYSTYM